jgi:Trp operon repressor
LSMVENPNRREVLQQVLASLVTAGMPTGVGEVLATATAAKVSDEESIDWIMRNISAAIRSQFFGSEGFSGNETEELVMRYQVISGIMEENASGAWAARATHLQKLAELHTDTLAALRKMAAADDMPSFLTLLQSVDARTDLKLQYLYAHPDRIISGEALFRASLDTHCKALSAFLKACGDKAGELIQKAQKSLTAEQRKNIETAQAEYEKHAIEDEQEHPMVKTFREKYATDLESRDELAPQLRSR